ncbi:MAG TPA: type II 3-dehydroquinate dehydratase [Allosphingosinicella sp.]
MSAENRLFVLNGPNMNLLGRREPEIYGHDTLSDVERLCRAETDAAGLELIFRQSNAEHELIGWIHEAFDGAAGIVINPAAFTHSSYAILDALKACSCPIVEVHISNLHSRAEAWRSKSVTGAAATGMICGLGIDGYALAVRAIVGQKVLKALAA